MCAKVCHFDHFDVKAIAETIHLHRILYIELLVRDIERGESFVRVVAQALCIFNRQFLCADFEQSRKLAWNIMIMAMGNINMLTCI